MAPMLEAAARAQMQAPILPLPGMAVWQQTSAWAIEHQVTTRGPLPRRNEVVATFGTRVEEAERLAASRIDRVLRGADPAQTHLGDHWQPALGSRSRLARTALPAAARD
jgi:hypothetical protein